MSAKRIMIQGTMSGVGKSILTAALCRIFHQDGYRTAPFKSQNMALNSFITRDGGEMGRAQVLQAQAAGKVPDVRMNPILLKPSSDTGSQVIVMGKVRGHYAAAEYFRMKSSLAEDVLSAFNDLAEENDIIVIEGAGSPAEINLKHNDIVNMGLAKMLDAPVLLVGDIDPGGVFAQLYGTMMLLEEQERQRIIGTIINKFRGDEQILRPGLKMLENLTNVPVLGVIPYLHMDLDDEDSLSPRLSVSEGRGPVDIAVIRFPRVSNFTDFAPLAMHPAFSVRYVSRAELLGSPDLIILPGTKNTMGDLEWMRQNGLETTIKRLHQKRVPILGICGGYQMLGQTLEDPDNAEHGGTMAGLGLLDCRTVFSTEKLQTQTEACVSADPFSGAKIKGYQIHMGRTFGNETKVFCILKDGSRDGSVRDNVFGTYLHGLFDSGELTARLAEYLLKRKGMDIIPSVIKSHEAYLDEQLDLLADTVRSHLNLEVIYQAFEKWRKSTDDLSDTSTDRADQHADDFIGA